MQLLSPLRVLAASPRTGRRLLALTPAVLAAALSVGGCRGCANDHPYVPPAAKVADPKAGDAAALAVSEGPVAHHDGGVESAIVAPPDTTTWQVGGITLEAGGREFVLALVRDFDGDGRKDALAVVRPTAPVRKPGASADELLFFRAGVPPTSVARGSVLGVQPSCAPTARLEQIGPRSAFAEMGSACPRGPGERTLLVVRLPDAKRAEPALAFDAIVADPEEAPKLTIDVDAADRDKDGLDDVVLRLTLDGARGADAAQRLSARLAFFDRPAGPSRDPEEPEASLRTIAAQALFRAGKAKEAASVPALVAQMRSLYRAMCAEGGAPRLTKIHGGSAPSCGTSKPLEDLGVAEVRAYVTQGDALRAFSAADGAQLAPATKTSGRTTELQKLLADVAPAIEAKNVRVLAAVADAPREHHPAWGPLAFEYTGKLLVRHGQTVGRVDPETGEEQPADMAAWKDEVLSPDGKSRWLEAYHACEGVAVRATFAPTGDGDMSEALLPIAPRLGKACSSRRGDPVEAVPLAWGPRGLEAVVAGQPVLIKNEPPQASVLASFLDEIPPPGSPRSHSTKHLALAMPSGVLVRGRTAPDKWSMVRSAELEPYAELRRCTIDDDGSRLACVRRGKVVLVTLP